MNSARSFALSTKFALLALFCAVQVAANWWWLKQDTRPPTYDMAGHAILGINVARSLASGNAQSIVDGFLSVFPYPPLLYFVSAPFALVAWQTVDALSGAGAIFLVVLCFATFGIGRRMGGPQTGLLAAFLACMYPLIVGLSREYLVDVPLTAMVTLSCYLLIRTDSYSRTGASVGFGLSLGFGMLTKWTFAVFIIGPMLASFMGVGRQHIGRCVRNLLLAGIAGVTIAAPWYIHHYSDLLAFLDAGGFRAAVAEGDPATGLPAWTYYAEQLVDVQLLAPLSLLALVATVSVVASRKFDNWTAFLLTWVLVPYAGFSMYANKDPRYTLPFLPALALMSAIGLRQMRNVHIRQVTLVLVVSYLVLQFGGLTFGLSAILPSGLLPPRAELPAGNRHWTLYTEFTHIASPPRSEDWKVSSILADIVHDTAKAGTQSMPPKLLVIPNAPFFEAQAFIYQALADKAQVDVSYIVGISPIDSASVIAASDYVLVKTGFLGPAWTLGGADDLTQSIQDPGRIGGQFAPIGTYSLPDHSVATLYRRR